MNEVPNRANDSSRVPEGTGAYYIPPIEERKAKKAARQAKFQRKQQREAISRRLADGRTGEAQDRIKKFNETHGEGAFENGATSKTPTPAPRAATEAMKIVGNGNMGANVPALPRGRRAMPAKMRKGRAK